ncbi:hypothetical protein M8C21_004464 [Ambrosia artemisiifolia]|uniref:Glutaredoxin-like protein n=1 Tax=Ambrosia artemisiifolia TaxID=4212 RepID=A0AAD5CR99_AMBAR|nr:hypothetical protein M8C21_004464 [Ambrosia artemisiifolia]
MAATVAAIVLLPATRRTSSASTIINISRKLNITSCCNYSSSSPSSRKQLILYSKPGCCLCDGLKEKLHSAFSLSSSNSLNDVDLQIRDITTNPDWEKAYQYEIPVLTTLRSDGTEEVIPRFSPRAGVDHIQSKLAAALSRDD